MGRTWGLILNRSYFVASIGKTSKGQRDGKTVDGNGSNLLGSVPSVISTD